MLHFQKLDACQRAIEFRTLANRICGRLAKGDADLVAIKVHDGDQDYAHGRRHPLQRTLVLWSAGHIPLTSV